MKTFLTGAGLQKKRLRKELLEINMIFPTEKNILFESKCNGTYHWVQNVHLAFVLTVNDLFL